MDEPRRIPLELLMDSFLLQKQSKNTEYANDENENSQKIRNETIITYPPAAKSRSLNLPS